MHVRLILCRAVYLVPETQRAVAGINLYLYGTLSILVSLAASTGALSGDARQAYPVWGSIHGA